MPDSMKNYDAIVVGSGFGGSMTAKKLIEKGWNVVMVERGEWVERGPHNWDADQSIDTTPYYDMSIPYKVEKGGNRNEMGVYACVGGPSVFYGGVSFRLREEDFHPPRSIINDSGASWPIEYKDLEPYYEQVESVLQISGDDNGDPTAPFRKNPYPQQPNTLANVSERLKAAASDLNLSASYLPLAINHQNHLRNPCRLCTTCDTFACAVEAKNDLATMVIKDLIQQGMTLFSSTLVISLQAANNQVKSLNCLDRKTGKTFQLHGKIIVLSAGALASPHILLSSGFEQFNPGGKLVGRYLMRHVNALVYGIFPGRVDKEKRFHKELAIMDYYFGHEDIEYPKDKIGSLQQVSTPPSGLVANSVIWPFGNLFAMGTQLLTGLLAIAEDQPLYENKLQVDRAQKMKGSLAKATITHEYTARDKAAINALTGKAKNIMLSMGAIMCYTHHIRTFSHAVGTLRMGENPKTSVLSPNCQFRGVENLYVIDGSFMPFSGAVNPSLTIGANALRVADFINRKH